MSTTKPDIRAFEVGREIELKIVPSHRLQLKLLSILRGDSLDHAVGVLKHALSLGRYAFKPIGKQSLVDDYFDTPDLDLFRTGRSLRIRTCNGKHFVTLKLPKSVERGKFDRNEFELELSPEQRTEKYLHGIDNFRPQIPDIDVTLLVPVLQVTNQREVFVVTNKSETYELAIDIFRFFNPKTAADSSSQFELEIEAKTPDAEAALPGMRENLLGLLSTDRPFEAASESKYSRGVQTLGLNESANRRRIADWVTSRSGAVWMFRMAVWAFVLSIVGLIVGILPLIAK